MNDELYHHGILGQKWGVRRYQNTDGTLTEAGKKHYGRIDSKMNPNTKSRFKGQADDIVSSANRRITEDKKILKDIKGGILDKNDPKVRKRFETEAKDRIEKMKKEWTEEYYNDPKSFNLREAIAGDTYYEVTSGKTKDYADWLLNEHNSSVKSLKQNGYTNTLKKEIKEAEQIVNKFSSTPISKLYEEAGGNITDLQKDLSNNLTVPSLYEIINNPAKYNI